MIHTPRHTRRAFNRATGNFSVRSRLHVNMNKGGFRFSAVWQAISVLCTAVAILASTVILPQGMGAFSLFRDAAAFSSEMPSLSTGAAKIISATQPTYLRDGVPFDPAQDRLEPGQTLTVSFDVTVRSSGTRMLPELALEGWLAPSSVGGTLDISVTSGALVAAAGPQTVPVTIVLSSTTETLFLGEEVQFSAAQLILKTGTEWADTKPLGASLQSVRLSQPVMKINYDTTIAGAPTKIVLPISGLLAEAVTIDWGDGSPLALVISALPSHVYPAGAFTVTITGVFSRFGSIDAEVLAANQAITAVTLWRNNGVTNAADAFHSATHLTTVVPPPATVTNMARMFFGASVFNQDIANWNVAAVTDMTAMFAGASAFAADLSQWNVETFLPIMPPDWNLSAPGLAPPFSARWPLPWQPDIMQIRYDTTLPGASTNIVVPLSGLLGTVTIDWGDGTAPSIVVAANPTHGYVSGQYTATIRGRFTSYGVFSLTGLPESNRGIVAVPRWDENGVTSAAYAFQSASNLLSVAEPPSTVTNFNGMFASATKFNQPIGSWNTSKVTSMGAMFNNATAFDQDLGAWNLAQVTSFSSMFLNATAFNNGESPAIGTWNTASATSMFQMFQGANKFNQPIGQWNVSQVANMDRTFSGATAFSADLSAWNVETLLPVMPLDWNLNAPGLAVGLSERWPMPWQPAMMQINYDTAQPGATTNIVVPIGGLTLGTVTIDWGDGSAISSVTAANPTHVYAPGKYTATILGRFTTYGSSVATGISPSNKAIVSVTRWSNNAVTSAAAAFYQASNLISTVQPPRTVTNFNATFQFASKFNQNIGSWDVSNITNMAGMFNNATAFNQNIAAWNTAKVTSMSSMFVSAAAFNQPLGSWNTGNVINSAAMFSGATTFNQDLGAWNTAKNTSFASMFLNATAFNNGGSPSIGTWNTSAVTTMRQMFQGASKFNQPIGNWNVVNVTVMDNMFYGATVFAADLASWNVWVSLPTMPVGWNTSAPGLAPAFNARWPFPWQPPRTMQLRYDTSWLAPSADVIVPLSGLSYIGSIDWGDGSPLQLVTASNPSHHYAVPGIYTVTVNALFSDYGSSDPATLASNTAVTAVLQWEPNGVVHADHAFNNATHLTAVARPPASVQTMSYMFKSALVFNQNIADWNVAAVTDMTGMFSGAAAFAQNLSVWNVDTYLPTMPIDWNLSAPGLSTTNSLRWPLPWQSIPVMQINYDTTLPGATTAIVVPISGLSGTVRIAWGDGSPPQTVTAANPAHSYAPGKYSAKIYGNFASYGAASNTAVNAANVAIESVSRWDANGITSAYYAFNNAKNLTSLAKPPTSITNMQGMLRGTAKLNQPIGAWDVSNVTDMSWMFAEGAAMNQDLGAWNVSKVQTMSYMFYLNSVFNNGGSSAINNWNTAALTNLESAFNQNTAFNQPIGNWNVSKVTTFQSTFRGATVFNQNIGAWDVSKATAFGLVFSGATAFNNGGSTSISNWSPSSATGVAAVFRDATAFNQPVGSWNVGNAADMRWVFQNATSFNNGGVAAFNWNTGNATNMTAMFDGAIAFDQNIGSWNTSKVVNMSTMFQNAKVFNNGANPSIGTWNVTAVADMTGMFNGATAFDQNLAAWDVGANLPTMPAAWNTNSPGLSSANSVRWPAIWHPGFLAKIDEPVLVDSVDYAVPTSE